MEMRLVYVELKTDGNNMGPAWIGKAALSKTGRTIYFDGKALACVKGGGVAGNYLGPEGEYWVSGVKKNRLDRHLTAGGKVLIDESIVEEYLRTVGRDTLCKSKFELTRLDNDFERAKERNNAAENLSFNDSCDDPKGLPLRFKGPWPPKRK